jgi:hypothetical protein
MKQHLPLYLNERTTKHDVECVILARLGFPYKTIAKCVNLSKGQVGYRLKIAGVSPLDYRRGESELAQRVMAIASEDSKKFFDTMASTIRRYLKD